ncbi:MAG: PhoH family protein [Treponemataceae bacterium]
MAKKEKKIYILDTNVILHDFRCIYQFQENDIVIPITVLEELDKFKKGNDLINFQAREFTRELDSISGDSIFTAGLSLGPKLGKLFIETGKPFSKTLADSFPEQSADHRILAITEYINAKNPEKKVALVSKDINLRMKAKSLGLQAEDYESDKIHDVSLIDRTIEIVEKMDSALITGLYDTPEGIPLEDFNFKKTPTANQYFILKNGTASALAHYCKSADRISRVEKLKSYGIEPRNAEQAFSLDALMRSDVLLVALSGKAGTGKTLLALAAALAQESRFDQILLARPIVPLANRDIGFLPGDVNEKISPYMQPLFDNLSVIKHKYKASSKEALHIDEIQKTGKLTITPLAYIRGRSLSNVFFIVDEAQNLTPHEVKTIITRASEGTKMVFTGDIQQIDSPYLDSCSNGLSYLIDKMKGQELFAHVHLVKSERSYLAELASDLL